MELLDSYLKAVKRYLPRAQRTDIVAELSEELRSQMEAREAELERPLNDAEQYAVLKAQGDPMDVARRYSPNRRSLSIGWELIGPELFPMYLIMLGLNLTIAICVTVGIMFFIHVPIGAWDILRPLVIQVVCVTFTFTILNLIRRKCPQPWYYPPAAIASMLPVARWYSISGLVVWSSFTLWWLLIPAFPRLLLGSASEYLKLGSSWHRFYLPILLLLGAGIAQRAINLVRPMWNWLLPVSRLVINCIGLALQYPMIKSYPYVVVAAGVANSGHYSQVAQAFNDSILWGVLSWLWVWLLANVLVFGWYCVPHLRRLIRGQHNPVRPAESFTE